MTVSNLINDYLTYLEKEKQSSPKTLKNYRHYLAKFLEFSQVKTPEQITDQLVKNYKSYLANLMDSKKENTLKQKTQNYFLIALRSFLKYLEEKNIKSLSYSRVDLTSGEKSQIDVLTEEDIEKLMNAANDVTKEGLRDRVILELLLSSGILVSELASLNCEDVDISTKKLKVNGKNQKFRVISIPDECLVYIDRYQASRKDDFKPFLVRFQGRIESDNWGERMRLSMRSIERILIKYSTLARIETKATPHSLRHFYAAKLLRGGMSIDQVQKLLGHTNQASTQSYYQLIKTPE